MPAPMKDMAIALTSDAADGAGARLLRLAKAYADLLEGLDKSWLWMALAAQDIKLRYRGSILGPFWLTVSTAVMIGAMGLLYAKLLHTAVTTYLPFLTIGLVTWQFISTLINEGCTTFLAVQGVIQQVRLPFSLHAYRLVYRNLLVFAHNLIVVPLVFAIFPPALDWRVVWVLPALALLLVNGVWVSLLLGMVSARFRDVPPIIGSFLQVVFFVTPIFWAPDMLGAWQPMAELSPLFAAIDLMRAPLLGAAPAPHSWPVMLVVTALGAGGTFLLFARFRGRIAFWV
jgi:ABC-type polysaccharide/polyol phosphate export permease